MVATGTGSDWKRTARRVRRLLLRAIQGLPNDQNGALVVTYALILPLLLGVVGLGLETGIWYGSKRAMQTQADAAALSAAFERAKGNPDYATVQAAALKEAQRNGFVNAPPNMIVVNNPPTSGPKAGEPSAVEVILSERQSLLFSSLFLDGVTVRTRTVAAVETTGTACILALDPSASGAVRTQGNPTVNMGGCVLAANSTSSSAVTLSGSAVLEAESLWTAGNISISGSPTLSLERSPTVNAWPIDDPYGDVVIPSIGPCDHTNAEYKNAVLTIYPGVYCGGISFGTGLNITLEPGVYYIDGGDINISATAVLRCSCPHPGDGVTFVLTSSAGPGSIGTITINGGGDVVLSAPTGETDPFKGILVYQDNRAPPGPAVKFNGGSSMLLTGAIYVPNQTIEWSGGNTTASSTCTQIIGRQVKFVGNSTIVNTGCEAAGVEPLKITGVRVVE